MVLRDMWRRIDHDLLYALAHTPRAQQKRVYEQLSGLATLKGDDDLGEQSGGGA